jgi:hypothetical protein
MDARTRKTLHSSSHRTLKGRALEAARWRLEKAPKVSVLASRVVARAIEPVLAHLAAAVPETFRDVAIDPAHAHGTESGPPLDPSDEMYVLDEALHHAGPAQVRVLFTARAFSDNWFSHWHASRSAAVVSLAGWGGDYGVPVEAFVAYELVLHGLRTLGRAWSPEQLTHAATRGCLFDFCENREDIEIKLQAADLCPSCLAALERDGVPLDRLRGLLEVVRTLAVPARVVH